MLPKVLSLVCVVLLLGWMFYLMVGCSPLLILKHDDPHDSRLIRGFFDVHYLGLMGIASVGALSSIFADRRLLATVFACIALTGFIARRLIVSRMDRLRGTMNATDAPAIKNFRRLHVTGLVLNLFVLIGFFSTLRLASSEIVSCIETPPGCSGEGCRVVCSLV